jgi:hypothetical protein
VKGRSGAGLLQLSITFRRLKAIQPAAAPMAAEDAAYCRNDRRMLRSLATDVEATAPLIPSKARAAPYRTPVSLCRAQRGNLPRRSIRRQRRHELVIALLSWAA